MMNSIRHLTPFIAAVLLLLLLFGLPSIFYPFGRDQGIHAQVGAAWLDGDFPYRDVWHPKGFLSFVPHALVTAVFGHTMWGIRLFDLFWQFGSGLLIFQIGRRRMSDWGALTAVGLYYLVYYSFGYWHLAQPEGFLTPVVLLAVCLYDRAAVAERPNRLLFLSGLVIALAPWFKQTAAVFVAGLLLWAGYDYWKTHRRFTAPAIITAGILVTNIVALLFTAVTGMLNPMLEAFSYALFEYPNVDQAGITEIARLTFLWGVWYPALIFPFLAGLGYLLSNRTQWPRWLGLAIMASTGLGGVYVQHRLWLYHWVSTLPFLVLIGAFSIDGSRTYLQSIAGKKQKGFFWLFGFAVFSLVLPILSRHFSYDFQVAGYLSRRMTETAFLEEYELRDVVETAGYLAAHTAPDDPVFVWGHYAIIYYLADRPNPTRFINDPPLSLPHSRREKWRQEAAADLIADPPVYIVVATDDTTGFESQTSEEQLPSFDDLDDFLAANYELETVIGEFEIYFVQ